MATAGNEAVAMGIVVGAALSTCVGALMVVACAACAPSSRLARELNQPNGADEERTQDASVAREPHRVVVEEALVLDGDVVAPRTVPVSEPQPQQQGRAPRTNVITRIRGGLTRRRMLCASLAFAAGAMVLLSFTEILEKATSSFERAYAALGNATTPWQGKTLAETNTAMAQNAAFLCFFVGVIIVYILSAFVQCVMVWTNARRGNNVDEVEHHHHHVPDVEDRGAPVAAPTPTPTPTPTSKTHTTNPSSMLRVGLLLSLTIGLHNLPEGLATFVAALDDPKVGGMLAFAIAVHNIPEGICVAAPVVLGTGNVTRAMVLATISGLAEVLGGLIGLALASALPSDETFGALFGVVGGMMTCISIKDLLPEARDCDDSGGVVTSAFAFGGMGVMASSIALFRVA